MEIFGHIRILPKKILKLPINVCFGFKILGTTKQLVWIYVQARFSEVLKVSKVVK